MPPLFYPIYSSGRDAAEVEMIFRWEGAEQLAQNHSFNSFSSKGSKSFPINREER